ncbi:N-acetyltransferase family protein [Nocardioides sp.]|uniref:GNAT family N-acetyltransferase n=1 Tax=Nocardioides sp. TaxID=35761 RepID=UPI0035B3E3E7
MEVRAARPEDAPALGRVMVGAWLSAHHGQMPEAAWQKRVEEWTPEVSAQGWARMLSSMAAGDQLRTVLLVAEEEPSDPVGLVLATEDEGDVSGATAQVNALYVLPTDQGRGTGRLLLRTAAAELRRRGFSRLHVGVLTANLPARGFYEAMGGHEVAQRTFDEEGVALPETVYGWSDLTLLAPEA